jgi:N-sulfoglucosamine sulfohydrolase
MNIFLRSIVVWLLSLCCTPLFAIERPNILFVLAEDQGAQLGLLGTSGLQTPNIDAIARSGVYFDNAFVVYPVCSASKAAIYTSLYNHTNGILNNTHNYHKPADKVTQAERETNLAKTNRIREPFTTLTRVLKDNGYYQAVTHKLHVQPNEKFPYDEFLHGGRKEIEGFVERAKERDQPWFLLLNLADSHRPYPNSDQKPIRVQPDQVKLPAYLPDSPVVRKDWAEYLAGIEAVDALTGEAMDVLEKSGQSDRTIVIYMSDHGPTFQHGKMTLYDLGLRVPLAIRGPGISSGVRKKDLVSEMDLFPTILDLCSIQPAFPYSLNGHSIKGLLTGDQDASGHKHVFAEISNRGPLPNHGMQERSVFDGRWKLIYREKVATAWRQVNADSREFKKWGNRTYAETIRLKDKFPEQYRILAEMDPQNLKAPVPKLELYDLQTDPDEMRNLAALDEHKKQRDQLLSTLRDWVKSTNDPEVNP